jgi:hypothetical protein
MSTLNTGLKALACGLGALAITAVMSWTFVESTSTPPWTAGPSVTSTMVKLTIQPRHVWFGQSQPAVLVD